jgi:hypothetical protein
VYLSEWLADAAVQRIAAYRVGLDYRRNNDRTLRDRRLFCAQDYTATVVLGDI